MPKIKLLFVFSILLFVTQACNELHPIVPATPTMTPVAEPPGIPLTEADVPRVSLGDALTAYNDDTAIFVDVRGKDAFKESHISGSTNIQLGEFETNPTRLNLPKDKWIITYCT